MQEKKTVLVVDDEPMIRDYLELFLQRRGYDVVTCRDGQEALDAVLVEDLEYDLLLTDKSMPRLTGPELARRLRERGCGQPAVLMTAESILALGELPGIDHVFQKPVSNDVLAAKIEELLAASATP